MLIISLLVSLCVIGCVEMPDAAQPLRSKAAGEIHGTRTVGQTFVASHDGLSRIDVRLATYGRRNSQSVVFHLRSHPSASTDIATITVGADDVENNAYHSFRFPPVPGSAGRSSYFFLESPTSRPGDAITTWHSPDDVHAGGQMYLQGNPQGGDLAFKTYYTYRHKAILRDLYTGTMASLRLVPLVILLYLLPGYALLQLLAPDLRLNLSERLALSLGLTLALMPSALLMASLVSLRLGRLMTVLLLAGAGLIALWRTNFSILRSSLRDVGTSDVSLGSIFLIALLVRLLVVRDWTVPMWADSYQHTVIAQLMVDHGGLFDSWLPYAPFNSFTAHFGFHSTVAFFHWLTGIGIARSVIIVGQILNTLSALTLYPLTVRLAQNRWAGVGAVLVAGLLSPMPMHYVNWGRYPQLAGQVVLPVALWLLLSALETPRLSWGRLAMASLALVGLCLTYYRMAFFYAAFVIAWGIGRPWGLRGKGLSGWTELVKRLVVIGLLFLLLVLPWIPRLFRGRLPAAVGATTAKGPSVSQLVEEYRIWQRITSYVPRSILVAALIGLSWSIFRRRWPVTVVGLWALGLASLVALRFLHVPGAGMMQNFAVLIALYIPVSLLVGWLVGELAHLMIRQVETVGHVVAAVALMGCGLWGARQRMTVFDPSYQLVTGADEAAMYWISEHTSPDARFLVNGCLIYGGTSAIATDAGWWIPLLANRQNTMPPQYALFNESEIEPGYGQRVVELVARLRQISPASEAGLALLCREGVSHVYIGRGQEQASWHVLNLSPPLLSVDELAASGDFERIYHQPDRVWVFALTNEACQ